LAQRRRGSREFAILFEARAVVTLLLVLVWRRRIGGFRRIDMGAFLSFGRVGKPSTSMMPE